MTRYYNTRNWRRTEICLGQLDPMIVRQDISVCRACQSNDLYEVADFGDVPIADALLHEEDLEKPEDQAPLTLLFCKNCFLVQIKEDIDPKILFGRDYPYYSSVIPSIVRHFNKSAEEIIASRKLGKESFVLELASNDGVMLQNFVRQGIPSLGIDPAKGPVKAARKKGIETIHDFFSADLAKKLITEGRPKADVILGNNVLAHVSNTNSFVQGIAIMMRDDGIAVIEVPYLIDLIDGVKFDTISHQHIFYYSLLALKNLFKRHGLYINDYKHLNIHGGSLRLFISKTDQESKQVQEAIQKEISMGVDTITYYSKFSDTVNQLKSKLLSLLDKLKKDGNMIIGYGAAGKANTLLNVFGIGDQYLDYIADINEVKQGLYFSGNHLKIEPPSKIYQDNPEYILILAWNFADEIIAQNMAYLSAGGKFIVPIPAPKIIS